MQISITNPAPVSLCRLSAFPGLQRAAARSGWVHSVCQERRRTVFMALFFAEDKLPLGR